MLSFLGTGAGAASALAMVLAKATLLLLAALGVSARLQRASAGARHLVWVAIIGALLVLPALAAWSPLRLRVLPAEVTAVDAMRQTIPTATLPQTEASPNAVNVAPATLPATPSVNAPSPAISPWRLAAMIWALIALAVGA